MDKTSLEKDVKYHFSQASLSAQLTDEQREQMMRDLYELYIIFQKSKSQKQIEREKKAWAMLDTPKIAPKYLQALKEAQVKGQGFFGT